MKQFYAKALAVALALSVVSCVSSSEVTAENSINVAEPQSYDFTTLQIEEPHQIPAMSGVSPDGAVLDVNTQYFTLNGEPWLPSYGEFQYSRYPAEHWEDAIIKMKSVGFTGLSCYVFWIHHEEREGEWNWTGRRNFRHFLELCKKHDLKVFARIGPWVNGECRNGGHPDWLMYKLGNKEKPLAKNGSGGVLRTTDPRYLHYVDKLYEQLSIQMKGMLWKDGGPVFAVQLDNENKRHGAGTGADLLAAEKELALKNNIIVPYYTSTGWGGADFNQDETLPMYGTYVDYFWNPANYIVRPRGYSFTKVRAEAETDTEVTTPEEAKKFDEKRAHYAFNPYLTCEIGTGMNIAYHRRPVVDADDDAVVSLVELGSGVNAMGYFMFLGGNNPKGKYSSMNRTILGGSNDNAVISNDFQAAIGEFGQVRDKYHVYPAQLNFMADFGADLAPCQTFIPKEIDQIVGGSLDNSLILQQAVRTDGNKGFVFVNNHIKRDTTYQFNDVQFEIKLKDETLMIPENAVDIEVGDYFYWPFNLELNGVKLKYATAQPVCHIDEKGSYLFFQNGNVTPEFVISNENISSIRAHNAEVVNGEVTSVVRVTEAGLDCYADITLESGETVRLMVITEAQSRQMYKIDDMLYLSDAEALKFTDGEIEVISQECENNIWCYPSSKVEGKECDKDGLFDHFTVNFEPVVVPFEYEQIQDGKDLKIEYTEGPSGEKIMAPVGDSLYNQGTILDLRFPDGIPSELYDVRVKVDYEAAALKFYKDGEFEYDFYYNGTPWVLGARHQLADYTPAMDLKLKFLPLQPDDKIYIDGKYWPNEGHESNVLTIRNLTAIPVYSTILSL